MSSCITEDCDNGLWSDPSTFDSLHCSQQMANYNRRDGYLMLVSLLLHYLSIASLQLLSTRTHTFLDSVVFSCAILVGQLRILEIVTQLVQLYRSGYIDK